MAEAWAAPLLSFAVAAPVAEDEDADAAETLCGLAFVALDLVRGPRYQGEGDGALAATFARDVRRCLLLARLAAKEEMDSAAERASAIFDRSRSSLLPDQVLLL